MAIGSGDTFEVVRDLLTLLVSLKVSIDQDLLQECRAWLTGYAGCEDVLCLQVCVDSLVPLEVPESTSAAPTDRFSNDSHYRVFPSHQVVTVPF